MSRTHRRRSDTSDWSKSLEPVRFPGPHRTSTPRDRPWHPGHKRGRSHWPDHRRRCRRRLARSRRSAPSVSKRPVPSRQGRGPRSGGHQPGPSQARASPKCLETGARSCRRIHGSRAACLACRCADAVSTSPRMCWHRSHRTPRQSSSTSCRQQQADRSEARTPLAAYTCRSPSAGRRWNGRFP